MNIQLNGETYRISEACSVAQLVAELGLAEKRIAVEYNLEILPRSEHANVQLQENDRVEIVQAIGGG
jgi:thiamine biosynthesis protein ThiS